MSETVGKAFLNGERILTEEDLVSVPVSWDAVQNKPPDFPPEPHSHTIGAIEELGRELATRAPFDSPNFIGTPTINNKPVATEEWVDGKGFLTDLPHNMPHKIFSGLRHVAPIRNAGPNGTLKFSLPDMGNQNIWWRIKLQVKQVAA